MVYAVVKIKFDERCKLMQKKKRGVSKIVEDNIKISFVILFPSWDMKYIILNIHMESTAVSNS